MMKKIYLSILFSALIGASGCSQDVLEPPDRHLTPEQQQVLDNCRLVEEAAEHFAARSNGRYPADVADLTTGGLTLIDLLPGGQMLENPITGMNTSPVNGGANNPGDVGYIGFRCDVEVTSYAISGVGEVEGDRFVMLRRRCNGEVVELIAVSTPTVDDQVLENCFVVQAAAEAYAAGNDGVYAVDETTPNVEGNTLTDLLPNGELLVNPTTGDTTEPSSGCRHGSGKTRYDDFWEWDNDLDQYVQTGYYITGLGVEESFMVTNIQTPLLTKERQVIENCLLVRDAAEAFAADNNGVYSNGLADYTPAGMTVIDYLPVGRLLVNPFTGYPTEPVVGVPAARGSTGYLALDIDGDGTMDGYKIDGLGGDPCWHEIYRIRHPPR
jgi:hypothetical protein